MLDEKNETCSRDIAMKKILVTRKRKESSSGIGDELQQERMNISLLDKEKTIISVTSTFFLLVTKASNSFDSWMVWSKEDNSGRELTIYKDRRIGFWVVIWNAVMRGLAVNCTECRRLTKKIGEQKVATYKMIKLLKDYHLQIVELTSLVLFW